jgi:hypothetical protein
LKNPAPNPDPVKPSVRMMPLIPMSPGPSGKSIRTRTRTGPNADCARRIKRWTRDLLGLDAGEVVSVTEMRCSEPGCPDIETVIGIPKPGGSWRTLKIAKKLCRVRRSDIALLLR